MVTGNGDDPALAHIGGRAFGPGPRRRTLVAGVALAVAMLAAALILLSSGGTSPTRNTAAGGLKYGRIPDWIPQQTAPSDAIVSATAGKPVLAAAEGDTVRAQLSTGSAYVTGVGPSVPNWVQSYAHAGKWPAGSLAPSTFTFTIAVPKGVLPLRASAFSILTAQGQILRPAVTVRGGGPLPATIHAGQPINLTLKAKLPEGEGSLRWAPGGKRVLVGWMYELELD